VYDAGSLAEVLGGVRAEGGTALHDAMLTALSSMQLEHDAYYTRCASKYEDVKPRFVQLVVVTDGEDVHSVAPAAAVAERLRAPGLWAARAKFQATLVGVGAAAAGALTAVAGGAKHVRVVAGAEGADGLKAAFKRVVEHMREAVVTVTEVQRTVTRVALPPTARGVCKDRRAAGALGDGRA